MALIEEIQQMKASGASDQEILQTLQANGISPQQAYEAMSQATIKDAVVREPSQVPQYQQADLQPSLISQPQEPQEAIPQGQYQQYPQEYAPQYSQDYSYAPAFSTDTISEIADQLLTEKISIMKENMEKAIDFKTIAETKLQSIDERLQRIEKIIDRLQLSILQKVGEQMTNVEDIKKEMIETQKTFKALLPGAQKHPYSTQKE